jgi:NitT/TauT family transport system substrate-binding protein
MERKAMIFTVLLLALAVLAACSPQEVEQPLEEVTVQLQWTHQAEFAGFYAADQNGYYTEEGLKVTFLAGGPEVDNLAAIIGGQAQFGTATADQLMVSRAGGQPLKAIAVVYRRSPTVFYTLPDSGITGPQEFAGKTIRVPSTIVATLHAMTARVGVSPDQYTEVNLPSDDAMFLTGEVPVWGGYLTVMAVSLQQAGYYPNLIYPDDYGVHFCGDVIVTTDDLIANHPDLLLRFLRASLRGWQWAIENPAEAGPLALKYDPALDEALQVAMMEASVPLIYTGVDPIGWMQPKVWEGMHAILLEQGLLDGGVDINQVYTLAFLQQVYEGE